MHVVRESSSGHPMSRKEHEGKGKAKKSNWELVGKGKGSPKADLDEKGGKHKKA